MKSKLQLGLKGERAQQAPHIPRHCTEYRDTVWRLGFGVSPKSKKKKLRTTNTILTKNKIKMVVNEKPNVWGINNIK